MFPGRPEEAIDEFSIKFSVLVYYAAWSWIQGGMNTDGAHNPVTSRPFKSGDIVSLNCFPVIAGSVSERRLAADAEPFVVRVAT